MTGGSLPDENSVAAILGSDPRMVVPVTRTVSGDLETPVSAFLKVAGDETAFLLESVEGGERWGRYSFIGLDPFLEMTSYDGKISWYPKSPPSVDEGMDPLRAFQAVMGSMRSPDLDGLPPFHGGAVGYLGYETVGYLEDLPKTTKDDVGAPEALMLFPRTLLAFDHLRQEITGIANMRPGDDYTEATARIDEVLARLGDPITYLPAAPQAIEVDVPDSTMSLTEFTDAVKKARSYIEEGDIFQVVVSHRLSEPLGADPFDFYRMLRLVNPSPYMFFIRHPDVVVVGSSPEPLVKVQGRQIIQRPIAGTRPRGKTPKEDSKLEEELLSNPKERAEHVMLVDLARNDVGRVSEYGSVNVDELMIVERYSHVMHLVSQVSGTLVEGASGIDALYASFPAGTVSGAPKIRAMEIIDELEPTRRGPYAGVVGYFDFSGNIDTCIALRTAYIKDGQLHVQAGGGIVADSDPIEEWNESINKAKALLTAAAMARSD
jgi:anthranilate synthase component 1